MLSAKLESRLFGRESAQTEIGRYRLVRGLGRGGMGEVFVAWDPVLDRQVALKLVRAPAKPDASRRERLLREAKALARVSHPHVVTVHDAGLAGDYVYLTMDLVEGATMQEWLATSPSLGEIRRVFEECAHGLVAVHAAGLVHCDFKPTNVIIDVQGRARLLDFGLAALGLDRESTDAGTATPEGAETPSDVQRRIAGTPPYMAPEQHDGEAVDARTDVYAYCVVLFRALTGEPPFPGETMDEIAASKRRGLSERSQSLVAQRWLRTLLTRGLQPIPEQRFATMSEVLAVLERHRRRRVVVRPVLGAVLLATTGLGVAQLVHQQEQARCSREGQAIDGVWSDEASMAVREAMLAASTEFGQTVWDGARPRLDRYAQQWRALRTEACLEPPAQPEAAEAQVVECLEDRLTEVSAAIAVLTEVDAITVEHALQVIHDLIPVQECRRPHTPSWVPDESEDAKIRGMAVTLARARALSSMVRASDARALVDEVIADPAAAMAPIISARARLLRAHLMMQQHQGDYVTDLRDGLRSAQSSGDGEAEFLAMVMLSQWAVTERGDVDEALWWLDLAQDRVVPIGSPPRWIGRLALYRGDIAMLSGDTAAAIEAFDRVVALHERGELQHGAWIPYLARAQARERGGQLEAARDDIEAALRDIEDSSGDARNYAFMAHHRRGEVQLAAGELEDAHDSLSACVDLYRRITGPTGVEHVQCILSLAQVAVHQGEFETAAERAREALGVLDAAESQGQLRVLAHIALGGALLAQGRSVEARTWLEQAADSMIANELFKEADRAWVLALLGTAVLSEDPVRARELADQARALIDDGRPTVTSSATVLRVLAGLHRSLDEHDLARAELEQATAVASTPLARAEAQLQLARWIAGSEPAQAASLAQRARSVLRGVGPLRQRELDELSAM